MNGNLPRRAGEEGLENYSALLRETGGCKEVLHSYEVPCVVVLPISGGNEAFLEWIEAETGDGEGGGR